MWLKEEEVYFAVWKDKVLDDEGIMAGGMRELFVFICGQEAEWCLLGELFTQPREWRTIVGSSPEPDPRSHAQRLFLSRWQLRSTVIVLFWHFHTHIYHFVFFTHVLFFSSFCFFLSHCHLSFNFNCCCLFLYSWGLKPEPPAR